MPCLEAYEFKLRDGRQISGLTCGSQVPSASDQASITLLLHGWLDNAASFTKLIPLLPASLGRIIAIDLVGHGLSDHLPKGCHYVFAQFILDIVEILMTINDNTHINLIGHSLGAGVCSMLGSILAGLSRPLKRIILLDGLAPLSHTPIESFGNLIKYYVKMKDANGSNEAGGTIKLFASMREAAERRSQQNIGGTMGVDEAMLLGELGECC